MEDIASKRLTKEEINSIISNDIRGHYLKRESNVLNIENRNNNKDQKSKKDSSGILYKIKYRLMIKTIGALFVLFLVALYKYIPSDQLGDNKYINWIKAEYSKHYSKVKILEKIEDIGSIAYKKIENIVPDRLYNYIVLNYINRVKPEIINFKLDIFLKNSQIENTVAVFNENDILIDNSNTTQISQTISTSSELSLMNIDADEVLSKNISIIQPVSGTITSEYGARDEIFNGVNGYHTGIDIANSLNTEIKSATTGIVVLTQSMNKYYGNNIEIETNGVIFKYAHLNSIKVKEGQQINQGDIIGLMGSTGMSTGSHLHFEIIINSRTIDPRLILSMK